jgi:hypothetical protein
LNILSSGVSARRVAARAVAFVCVAVALANCGDDVDVCTNPGGGPCPEREYTIDFHVQTPGRFGALQLDIEHLGDSGGFVGREDRVQCVALVEAIVAANYLGERTVKIGIISLQGIATPADIVRCEFRTTEDLVPSDFEIEVTDASDTESNQIDPPPVVAVRTIVEH